MRRVLHHVGIVLVWVAVAVVFTLALTARLLLTGARAAHGYGSE